MTNNPGRKRETAVIDDQPRDVSIAFTFDKPENCDRVHVAFRLLVEDPSTLPPALREYVGPDNILAFHAKAALSFKDDLQGLRSSLLNKLSQEFNRFFSRSPDQSPGDQLPKLLEVLRLHGQRIFDKLVGNLLEPPDGRVALPAEHWKLMLKELRSAVRKQDRGIRFSWLWPSHRPEFLFPWGIVFDREASQPSADQAPELAGFWGFRHLLSEEFVPTQPQYLKSPPTIAATIDEELDSGGVHGAEGHPFHAANPCCHAIPCADPAAVFLALPSADLYYHYGRASVEEPFYWLLWKGKDTGEMKFNTHDLQMNDAATQYKRSAVLVFLNGCNTAGLDPTGTDAFIWAFAGQYPSKMHFITTIGQIPATFAAHLAELFFQRFLQGSGPQNAPRALRDARLALAGRRDPQTNPSGMENPLGLLYVYSGKHELRVRQPNPQALS